MAADISLPYSPKTPGTCSKLQQQNIKGIFLWYYEHAVPQMSTRNSALLKHEKAKRYLGRA